MNFWLASVAVHGHSSSAIFPTVTSSIVCIYKCPIFQLLNSKSQWDHTSHFSHPLKDLYCHLCSYVTSSSVVLDSYFFFTIIYFLTASLLQLSKSDPSPLLCIFLSLTLLSLPSAANPSAPNSALTSATTSLPRAPVAGSY